METLQKATGGSLPEIKFFNMGEITIAGHKVRALHHGMSGVPGLELFGPWDEAEDVRAAIVEAGEDFGLRQVGSRVYATNTLESGWIPCPLPAVFTGDEMKAYREWLPADGYEGTGSLGGSLYSDDIADYYLTPHDLGYWPFVKFDHDFVGREALEAMGDEPKRRKVTLAWNGEDVARAMGSLFEKGDAAKYIDLPLSNYSTWPNDKVIGEGGVVGVSTFSGYSYNERSMLSLGDRRRRRRDRRRADRSSGARRAAARRSRSSSATCRPRSARSSARARTARSRARRTPRAGARRPASPEHRDVVSAARCRAPRRAAPRRPSALPPAAPEAVGSRPSRHPVDEHHGRVEPRGPRDRRRAAASARHGRARPPRGLGRRRRLARRRLQRPRSATGP